MDIQIVDNQPVTEPITLAEVKSYLQIDADYSVNDFDLMIASTAARKRLEAYLNIGLVKREIIVYWDGSPIELPLSPTGNILEVLKNSEELSSEDYTLILMPANRISVNQAYACNGEWFYSIDGFVEFTPTFTAGSTDVYICRYETGYDELKGDLKQALQAEIAYIYQLRGEPVTDIISPNAVLLASQYSRNLIL